MSDVKWIKLSVNMFDDEKVRLIKTMPEGDKIIVIWVQLLCMAGKTNDSGLVYMGQNMAYTDEMLATIFGEQVNIVRIALSTLEQFGMIEIRPDGKIDILSWEKHQNIEGLERIKDGNAERQRVHYYRRKLKELGVDAYKDGMPTDSEGLKGLYERENKNLTLGLTLAHGPEEELEEDKTKRDIVEQSSQSDKSDAIPKEVYEDVISHLNERTGKKFRPNTKTTRKLINGRINDGFTVDDIKAVIDDRTKRWLNDKKMNEYLRPDTLFRPSNFESYLNAIDTEVTTKKLEVIDDNWENAINEQLGVD